MRSRSSKSRRPLPSTLARIFRLLVLLLPGALLIYGSTRVEGRPQMMLWLGGVFQVLVISALLLTQRIWQQNIGPSATIIYLIAIAWLWIGDAVKDDWYSHFMQFLLLVVPLLLFALQTLTDSGALTARRARLLAQRLAHRKDWPADLTACRLLPEVKALREAVAYDATPALALLHHARAQVRVAALAALEFRKAWRPGQAELVLRFAQHSKEPAIRAAAVTALANLDERVLVEQVAEFLGDPAPEVRRAANEALLWDTENRWSWIRHAVRVALSDPLLQTDGALRFDGILLKPEAVADLNAWATEKGTLGVRAALTLAAHYGRVINEQPGSGLIRNLKEQLANTQSAPALRMELAQLLHTTNDLDGDLLEQMVDAVNPAPLRLMAADQILGQNPKAGEPDPRALAALREIARLPNREMALNTADVVQRRLGVDMGLAVGQPLPPLHSRLAADVTRRLMAWVAQQDSLAVRAHDEVKARVEGEDASHPAEEPPSDHIDESPPDPRDRGHGSGIIGLGSGAH
jgi:hypothetical protein